MEQKEHKTIYDGKLHRCPNCGEQLNSFIAVCPVCGYELRGTQATSCVQELSQKLEQAETDEIKIELIKNFYIPNTKEDIYEFFILAYSNIMVGGNDIQAWYIKLEQAYLKAKVSFGSSQEYEQIKELYERIPKRIKKNRGINSRLFAGVSLFVMGVVTTFVSLLKDGEYDLSGSYNYYDSSLMHYNLQRIAEIGIACLSVGVVLIVWSTISKKIKNRKKK